MLIKKKIDEPYNKKPGDEHLPILSKTTIKSKLTKKFWKITEHIYSQKLPINQALPQEKKVEKNNIKIIKDTNKKITQKGNSNINNNINNKSNNKNNIKLKSKRVKTPTTKHTNIINIDKNKNGQYNSKDNSKNYVNQSKYQNELNRLREKAINLEEELEKNKKIIEYQEKENNELIQRIEKLTKMLKSIVPKDNI